MFYADTIATVNTFRENVKRIDKRFQLLAPFMNEKMRRLGSAAEADVFGHGGIGLVAQATGISRTTISNGLKELEIPDKMGSERQRKAGGGRKKTRATTPGLEEALAKLLEPAVRGEPDSPLLWTSKSLRRLSAELRANGYDVSHKLVGVILKNKGFRLQATRKTDEGKSHPDRDAQFQHIHQNVCAFQRAGQPVISVDAKKKELVGNFKNNGQEWHRQGHPDQVKVYDFPSMADGKAIPYGVYDVTSNKGWVSIGITHDTAEFAVETIRRWWKTMGQGCYPTATQLLITADGGGSNSSRSRLWKRELQKLADTTGLEIHVCHFPPATSKWNKIEHRLFSYITQNWRGKPLVSDEVIVNLMASTKTEKGLEVRCSLDPTIYQQRIKIDDNEFSRINLKKDDFHGEWNYVIGPGLTPK
jgi:hypothetical protein